MNESSQEGPRGSSPVRSMLEASGTRLAPTARGEEAAAPAETTCARSPTWTPSATATCSATGPSLIAALTSGDIVLAWSHLS